MSINRILRNLKFKRFVNLLKNELTEKRVKGKIKHPLHCCVIIMTLACLSGCNYFREYVEFAKKHENILAKLKLIPNGIPSHDTLERIASQIVPHEFDKIFKLFQIELKNKPIISIDGKNIRATKDNAIKGTYKNMKDIITAFSSEFKLSLISESKGDKGNEMNAIPKLLKRLNVLYPDLKPIITMDGIGTTNEILSLLKENNYDFVICYKRSESVLKEMKMLCRGQKGNTTVTKNSSRIEERTFSLYKPTGIAGIEQWLPYIDNIGRMDTKVTNIKTGEITNNTLFYFTSDISTNDFIRARRNHWAIENSLHYVLDNSFNEDRLRIKKGSASENMNLLRKFTLNVARLVNSTNESISAFRDSLKYASPQKLLYMIINAIA